MADVRTFRAASLEEALAIVRDELGQQAVVLHTREVSRRRLLPWLAPITHVEVTAGRGAGKLRAGRELTAAPGVQLPSEAIAEREPVSGNSAAPVEAAMEDVRFAARAEFGIAPSFETIESGFEFGADAAGEESNDTTTQEFLEGDDAPTDPAIPIAPVHFPVADSRPASMSDLETRLDSIQQALESLGQNRLLSSGSDVPIELFELYSELLDADVTEELARDLLQQLKRHTDGQRHLDLQQARTLLPGMVESELRCQGPIRPVPQTRKVVALVGPTGVGKTTTLAKLAANFRLRDGIRMGLVTVDTYRIAAVEQLRTYAEIIDLPMKVVTTPAEMRRALDELQGLDLVLIDTAGRSPRDELKIQELKCLLEEARVDEVHLVLSLTAGLKNLVSTIRNFRAANVTSLILTKLDEAESLGSVLSLSREVDLPISYLTTGQDVPDDIEPAVAARLARLILGRETLH